MKFITTLETRTRDIFQTINAVLRNYNRREKKHSIFQSISTFAMTVDQKVPSSREQFSVGGKYTNDCP